MTSYHRWFGLYYTTLRVAYKSCQNSTAIIVVHEALAKRTAEILSSSTA